MLISHWVLKTSVQKLDLGAVGVNIFFVLSGFLITEILFRNIDGGERDKKSILKRFYWRRVLRIFPVYYLVCFGTAVFNFADSRQLLPYNALYVTNIYNYATGYIGYTFSHIWSLCVEEQFYLFWPLLLILVSKNRLALIIGVISVAICSRFVMTVLKPENFYIYNYRMTISCFDGFGFGALLAYLKVSKPDSLKRVLKFWVIPFFCILLYVYNYISHGGIVVYILSRTLVSIIGFFIIGYIVTNSKAPLKILNNRFLIFIGRISYGIYVYHLVITSFLDGHVEKFVQRTITSEYLLNNIYLIKFPFYFIVTLVISTLSFVFYEKFFLRMKERNFN